MHVLIPPDTAVLRGPEWDSVCQEPSKSLPTLSPGINNIVARKKIYQDHTSCYLQYEEAGQSQENGESFHDIFKLFRIYFWRV